MQYYLYLETEICLQRSKLLPPINCFILFSIDPDISVTTPKDPEIDNGITDNPWSFTTPGPTTVSTTYRQCALPTLPGICL